MLDPQVLSHQSARQHGSQRRLVAKVSKNFFDLVIVGSKFYRSNSSGLVFWRQIEIKAQFFCNGRILVFKDAPKLLFTGLTKDIGNPREYEKNLVEGDDYFQSVQIDISIPLEETAQWVTLNPLLNQVSLLSLWRTIVITRLTYCNFSVALQLRVVNQAWG